MTSPWALDLGDTVNKMFLCTTRGHTESLDFSPCLPSRLMENLRGWCGVLRPAIWSEGGSCRRSQYDEGGTEAPTDSYYSDVYPALCTWPCVLSHVPMAIAPGSLYLPHHRLLSEESPHTWEPLYLYTKEIWSLLIRKK